MAMAASSGPSREASAVCQVFDKERILYHHALGEARPDSWFDLASVSKVLCTTMLLFAMGEGRLAPGDRLLDHLPEGRPGPSTRERLKDRVWRRLCWVPSGSSLAMPR